MTFTTTGHERRSGTPSFRSLRSCFHLLSHSWGICQIGWILSSFRHLVHCTTLWCNVLNAQMCKWRNVLNLIIFSRLSVTSIVAKYWRCHGQYRHRSLLYFTWRAVIWKYLHVLLSTISERRWLGHGRHSRWGLSVLPRFFYLLSFFVS